MDSYNFLALRKAPRSDPTVQEFQFVHVSTSLELDELSRMTVRVQSLRDFHRRKRELLASNRQSVKMSSKDMRATGTQQQLKIGPQEFPPTETQPDPNFIRSALLETHAAPSVSRSDSAPCGGKEGALMKCLCNYARGDLRAQDITQCVVCRSSTKVHDQSPKASEKLELGPGMGELDPFDSLPVPQTSRVQVLLHNGKSFSFKIIYFLHK
jgi:hypothetical protein